MKAIDLWIRNTTSVQAPGALWTVDAQTEYSTIANDLSTYVSGACLQFISGSRSMDEWDAFVEDAYASFDVERMTELYQEAVDAYLGA